MRILKEQEEAGPAEGPVSEAAVGLDSEAAVGRVVVNESRSRAIQRTQLHGSAGAYPMAGSTVR